MGSGWVYNCRYIDGPKKGLGKIVADEIPDQIKEFVEARTKRFAGEYTPRLLSPAHWVTYYYVGMAEGMYGNPLFSINQTPLAER